MVDRPPPERRGPGASPPGRSGMPVPLIVALIFIGVIAGLICIGSIAKISEAFAREASRPPREHDRLYDAEIRWNRAGCAYRADMMGGALYFSPHVVPDVSTPDPSDGKLLCDPTKARP